MTRMSRFLALIPVAAFTVACNGATPTGPTQISATEPMETASAEATAMTPAPSCQYLVRIDLDADPTPGSMAWVQATYQYSRPVLTPCGPPRWTSLRGELVVDPQNPMRAGFPRSAGSGTATLTATAPNRLSHTIVVDLAPPTRLADAEQACRDIAGVDVKVVPSIEIARVVLKATYVYMKPTTAVCSIAPDWMASRSGLTVDRMDPFRAWIRRRSDVKTRVTATSPNGMSGAVTF